MNEYLEQNKLRFLAELKELLCIPSISAQTDHKKDITTCAQFLQQHFEQIGLENCKIMETNGHPVVYADHIHAPNKPTILLYGHYDVQAPDPLNEWLSPPFEPTERDGNLYGRGTADDKGQFFTHIKALETLLKTENKLPVNIKIILEGEEEIGGVHLPEFIKTHKDLLTADYCVISDTHALSPTLPVICYGLRGLVYSEIKLQVLTQDVHSGTYGGNVPNAAIELAKIIGKLKNLDSQEVLIPGFYDNVRAVSSAEKAELGGGPFDEKFVKDTAGAKKLVGVEGFKVAERMGARPTLDVNGMYSGYTGEGAKTIIPARATAKISMRLVPNQTSSEIKEKFMTYVKSITPDYADIDIQILSTGEPIIMDTTSEIFKKGADAMTKTFGSKPVLELGGGSIPVTAELKNILGIDSLLMGFGLPDDGLHSPNEKLNIEMFYKGIETSLLFLKSFDTL